MKKVLLLLMFIPVLAFSQTKEVIGTFRVFPVPGKALEFKKALTAHVAKYHTTERKWRIFEVMTGPDAGAFHFVEGPSSWDSWEKAPQNTDAHITDWDKTVEVFVSKTTNSGYTTYNADMSTGKQSDYANNIILTHMYVSSGKISKAWDLVEKMKKAWELGNQSVAVYSTSFSGEPQIVTSRRLKNGLKELDAPDTFADNYRKANGVNSWGDFMSSYEEAISSRWSEMLMFRADLSSK
jgi:hypothetical protein